MLNPIIKMILILLFIFTPIPFGSVSLWACSLMELGILFIMVLWAFQSLFKKDFINSQLSTPDSAFLFISLFFFLGLLLFQMVPLPSGIIKLLSPKTYELRSTLSLEPLAMGSHYSLSFVPFATKVEFFKWLALFLFFLFLLYWKRPNAEILNLFIPVVMLIGIGETLYGMYELFSGHRHILHLKMEFYVTAVTGSFINRNHLAGYLLMVIPISVAYFLSRGAFPRSQWMGWRNRLSSLDGKTILLAFGIIVMILGLILSASRMGILSLFLSFCMIILFFRDSGREPRFSKTSVLIFVLALLWAVWIGIDAVINRFFTTSEDFKFRWAVWADTLRIIKDFPLFGSGLGTFALIFPMVRSFYTQTGFSHAENDFIQLASEVGLPGTILLFILFLYFMIKAISGIRSHGLGEMERYVGIGSMVGIFSMMLLSLVERIIQVPANAFLFTFLFAMILRIGVVKRRDHPSPYLDIPPNS